MDWLEKYRAYMDCFNKTVTFKEDEAIASVIFEGTKRSIDTRLVSTLKAERLGHSSCKGYIAFIR